MLEEGYLRDRQQRGRGKSFPPPLALRPSSWRPLYLDEPNIEPAGNTEKGLQSQPQDHNPEKTSVAFYYSIEEMEPQKAEDTCLKSQGWKARTLHPIIQPFAPAGSCYDHFLHFQGHIGASLASVCHFPALGRISHPDGQHSLTCGLGAQARSQELWRALFMPSTPVISPDTFPGLALAPCSGRPSLTIVTAKHLLRLL